MKRIPLLLFFIFGLTTATALKANKTNTTHADLNSGSFMDNDYSEPNSRKSRLIHEFTILSAPSRKIKREVIKIPSSVSKVKFVRPPLQLRHNRAPQQFVRYPANFRNGYTWRPPNKVQTDYNFELGNSFPYDPKKVKRNLKRPIVRDMTAEEFLSLETESEFEEERQMPKKVKKHRSVVSLKRKKPKQNILGEYLTNYEGEIRSNHEDGSGLHSSKVHYVGTEESQPFYGYNSAESSIHMRQAPSPSLYPQDLPNSALDKSPGQFYHDGNYIPALKVNKLPTKGRQIQSLFSQKYTTHNPHVTTNFGLNEALQPEGLQYGMKSFAEPASYEIPRLGKYSQPIPDASDLIVTSLPVKAHGIKVIQPPQFRDVSVNHPSHPSKLVSQQGKTPTSQKATIRDILDQDCSAYDVKGYCDSPPRYPTQQIKDMVKKCAELMDAMNTQPFEESQEFHGFAERIANNLETSNKSISTTLGSDSSFSWSRSSTEEFTACKSNVELTEPGYAKEVNSGRWFVIVQQPDTVIQRIATDTCSNPGKHCGGLSELKCTKISGLSGKSTRCVQRHTNQRLISWDPESPDECPRMRVFRFPSACTCHLDVM